jgi:hypothetical protein
VVKILIIAVSCWRITGSTRKGGILLAYNTLTIFTFCWLVTFSSLLIMIWQHWSVVETLLESERFERAQLLDRLMAKDFSQYKTADALSEITRRELEQESDIDFNDVGV